MTRTVAAKKKDIAAAVDAPILEGIDASLLDIVDHVLNKGIVITGDVVLGVADIDLIYLRVSAILCAADRVLGRPVEPNKKRIARHTARSGPTTTRRALLASKMGSPLGKKR